MPAGKEAASSSASEAGTPDKNAANRTTFRPPWVKEGPSPLPCPAAPWTLNKRGSIKEPGDAESSKFPTLRKVQKPEPAENGAPPKKETTFTKPQLRPVPPKEATKLQSNEIKIPIKLNSVKERELPPAPIKRVSLRDADEVMDSIDKAMPATRNALVRQESMKKIGVPMAPPMPPPPPAMPSLVESANLNDRQKERLTMLRSRPKTRPDWTQMLKEVESGRKLKHVECNDRSEPLLPKVKAKGQFLYDSEKQNAHNVLLKAIEQGVKLKKVKTNDRSKPILEGLRKFRRQMTIEEQIQKSQSMASIAPEEIADEADEMDDIDKVRDDLQSTKQLLAFEMRNKEAQMRENKRLVAKIQQLEAELEKNVPGEESSPVRTSEADEKLMKSIKSEVEEARKTSQELEKKYTQAAEDLDAKKTELEEAKKQNRELEKKVQELLQGKPLGDRKFSAAAKQESEDEEEDFDVSESESEGSDNEEKRERRAQREVKLFRNKLRTFKNKEDNAKKERVALKELMKKLQQDIKEEKKKFKSLQKEVDKMASLMKDSSEDEEDDDDEEEEDEEDKEETESESESSESESESSGSETDSEKSQSEAEDAPTEKIKTNLSTRAKRHENMLAALKKGNLMLKANAERLQDDFNKQRELTVALQEDLNSVLAELG